MIELVTIGEVLWDLFPEGKQLGGAPFNLCHHAKQLGLNAASVSRVGTDPLGEEILERAEELGLPLPFIQEDPAHPTGTVKVELDEAGKPTFTITENVAWDYLELADRVSTVLPDLKAIAFGSLAQRREISRGTIRAALALCNARYKLCDINLRPPFFTKEVITYSLETANILKLNDEELVTFQGMFSLPDAEEEACRSLAETFGLEMICITKGADGCTLFHENKLSHTPGKKVAVVDTVGSGDAFSAAFLVKLLEGAAPEEAAVFANNIGALVASKAGGTPTLDSEEIKKQHTSP